MKKEKWIHISDKTVRHIWETENGKEVEVDPSFYADCGTPIDEDTGEDLYYVRTEILTKSGKIIDS